MGRNNKEHRKQKKRKRRSRQPSNVRSEGWQPDVYQAAGALKASKAKSYGHTSDQVDEIVGQVIGGVHLISDHAESLGKWERIIFMLSYMVSVMAVAKFKYIALSSSNIGDELIYAHIDKVAMTYARGFDPDIENNFRDDCVQEPLEATGGILDNAYMGREYFESRMKKRERWAVTQQIEPTYTLRGKQLEGSYETCLDPDQADALQRGIEQGTEMLQKYCEDRYNLFEPDDYHDESLSQLCAFLAVGEIFFQQLLRLEWNHKGSKGSEPDPDVMAAFVDRVAYAAALRLMDATELVASAPKNVIKDRSSEQANPDAEHTPVFEAPPPVP